MFNITKHDINNIYNSLLKRICKDCNNANYDQCIREMYLLSEIISLFNWKYCDEHIECLIKTISEKIIKVKPESIIKGRYVFYDFNARDNCTLTQQYLRALMSWGADILFIPEYLDQVKSKNIIAELSKYPKAQIYYPNKALSSVERIKDLYNRIVDYSPEKIILQLAPSSVEAVVLFSAIHLPDKYYLDITDHRFFIGNQCADYYVTYRNRGCYIAENFRNISRAKILYMPYYPITNDVPFAGLSHIIEESKCVIMSAGSVYKVGDIKSEYFQILKRVLNENDGVVFVYIGMSNAHTVFIDFIRKNNFQDRIILYPFRKDIDEVIKRCDIYYNTYPYSGGLVCQYAAKNAKPIVAYNLKERTCDFVETVVCDKHRVPITHCTVEETVEEFSKLIKDESYRNSKGFELQRNIYTPQKFNAELYNLLQSNIPVDKINAESFPKNFTYERYLKMYNTTGYYFHILYFRNFDLFKQMPMFTTLKFAAHLIQRYSYVHLIKCFSKHSSLC